MSTAYIGHGTVLQRSDDGTSGGVFATVGPIYDITPPGLSRDTVDVTNHSSPEKWREFITGLKDGGEFSIDIVFDPGDVDVAAFLAEINTDTAGYYKIIFPDTGAEEWGFAALMIGFEATDPLDDRMSASVTYKLTGKPGFIV